MLRTPAGTPYWLDGGGRSLVFVHGVLMDHRTWQRQVEGLRRRFRIVRFDMLGHGDCADRPGERTLDDFVEQLCEVIRHVCRREPPVLVGFSMGGLIAQAYAIKCGVSLRGLVLMNAVYDRTPAEQLAVRARLSNLEQAGIEAVIEAARRRWFRADEIEQHPADIDMMMNWMRDGDVAAKTKAYRVFASADRQTAGRLNRVRCPALVMTGDGDRGSPPHMSEAMARQIPDARLAVFDRQQHMMPVLDAERVNAHIAAFVDALPKR